MLPMIGELGNRGPEILQHRLTWPQSGNCNANRSGFLTWKNGVDGSSMRPSPLPSTAADLLWRARLYRAIALAAKDDRAEPLRDHLRLMQRQSLPVRHAHVTGQILPDRQPPAPRRYALRACALSELQRCREASVAPLAVRLCVRGRASRAENDRRAQKSRR